MNGVFYFWEKIDELDVSRQEQSPGRSRAKMEFRMQEIELNQGGRSRVAGNEIAEFTENVTPHLNHVFVASRSLKILKKKLGQHV